MRPEDVSEDGKYNGRQTTSHGDCDIHTAVVPSRQRVDKLQAYAITRTEDAEIHRRMAGGHHLRRLALGSQPGVKNDESRLDGVDVIEPVPEPDHRTCDERRTQTIDEVETGSCFGYAHQAEQAGRGSEHETVVRAESPDAKPGVELPEPEPVGAQSRDEVGEQHRQRQSKPDQRVVAAVAPEPQQVAQWKQGQRHDELVPAKEPHEGPRRARRYLPTRAVLRCSGIRCAFIVVVGPIVWVRVGNLGRAQSRYAGLAGASGRSACAGAG